MTRFSCRRYWGILPLTRDTERAVRWKGDGDDDSEFDGMIAMSLQVSFFSGRSCKIRWGERHSLLAHDPSQHLPSSSIQH